MIPRGHDDRYDVKRYKVVSFLRLFLGEIASGVSGKVGFGVSVKGDP